MLFAYEFKVETQMRMMMSQPGELTPGITTLSGHLCRLIRADRMQLRPVTAGLVCSWTSG